MWLEWETAVPLVTPSPCHLVRQRPLLLPRKSSLNTAVEPLLDAINILHVRKVLGVLGHNLARLELFLVGEAVD
ncbi:MAG: hypothetical protein CL608_03260 [Anaerolineaceae bacterium]|nr:hypothetical protein [Anaerolineaceae bacterium]